MEGHAGPFFYVKGSLTASDKDSIYEATGVNASIRARRQWQNQRGLTLSGPVAQFEKG